MPPLLYENLLPTRNYLQNVCLALSAIQRAYIPENEHDWQYGLLVSMRGIATQEFSGYTSSLDLVRQKVRLGDANWALDEYAAPELFKNMKVWLQNHNLRADITEPEWIENGSVYASQQVEAYAQALWWMDRQFAGLKAARSGGLTSPVLLYPHHFDLSLVWFPFNDERQLAIGFSTGDEAVPEPYVYMTAYPENDSFHMLELPSGAEWHSVGFKGAVLPYAVLAEHSNPAFLLQTFANGLFDDGATLLT